MNSPHLKFFLTIAAVTLVAVISASALQSAARQSTRAGKTRQHSSAVSEGKKVFESICASCHGLDGRGGERGPNIVTDPDVIHRSDVELMGILRDGVSETGMPAFASLGEPTLQSVLEHLRTLQGGGRPSSAPGNPLNGKTLFFGKARCADCHMINGKGGFFASDLSAYASSVSVDAIRQAITEPNKNLEPRFRTVVVTTRSGKEISGIARNEDNFSLQLQSPDGAFYFLQKTEVAHIEYLAKSPMPSDYGKSLGPAELDDLIAYLDDIARSTVSAPENRKHSNRSDE